MTVAINQPVDRSQNMIGQLATAVGIAKDVFGVVMNEKQKAKLDELNKTQLEESDRLKRQDFSTQYKPVTESDVNKKLGLVAPSDAPRGLQLPEGAIGYQSVKRPDTGITPSLSFQIQKDKRETAQREMDRLNQFQNEFEKNKIGVQAKSDINMAQDVQNLVHVGNPIADEAARFKVARTIQGVGILTDKDIDRLGGSQAILDTAQRLAIKVSSGNKLTPRDREDLLEISRIFALNAKDKLKKEAERYAEQKSSYLKSTKDDLIKALNLDYYLNSFSDDGRQNLSKNKNQGLSADQIAARELLEEMQKARGTAGNYNTPGLGGR